MSNLKIGGQNVGKIYLGDNLLLGSSIECNTDKYLVLIENGILYFIDVQTLEHITKIIIPNVTNIKSYGKILKLISNGIYKLAINDINIRTSDIVDNYNNYSDVYCEDNFIVIAEFNWEQELRTTLKVNYPIATNLSKSGNLNISYGDESIRIIGKYKNYYVINFYNDSVNYLIDEQSFAVHTIESVTDNFIKMLVVDDIMYAFEDNISGDSYIYKIDSDAHVLNYTGNYIEDDAGSWNSINKHLIYFDDKIITYDTYGNFLVFDKDLNIVFSDYNPAYDMMLVQVLVINGKLWLINFKGGIIIRNSYNDTNQNMVKRLVKDDNSNFTNIRTIDKTEIKFN